MEPNKFEKHIKREMRSREIKPSANAWERISEQLDHSPEAKNNKFLWYSVAASFIGILIISILFFQSENRLIENKVQIVNTDTNEAIDEQDPKISKEQLNGEIQILEKNKISSTANEIQVSKEDLIEKTIKPKNNDANLIVLNDDNVKKVEVNELLETTDKSIELKIKEVLAQVDSIEQNNTALTNAEVDELLRNAQEEILRDKLFKQNGSVDATALLTEVENELDQSFRDQIFESLKEGFLKVRTAVAERNN